MWMLRPPDADGLLFVSSGKTFIVETVITAIVAAITSVVVTSLSLTLTSRQGRQAEERAWRREIESGFLGPLRLQAATVHIRLADVIRRVEGGGERQRALAVISEPAEASSKCAAWFAGEGCYLASTVYITACLFAWMARVSRSHPFPPARQGAGTELARLLVNVQRGFLRDFGIYSALQPSVGETMWLTTEGRLRTYREFCQTLTDPDCFAWLERLFLYYLEAGRGEKLDRVQQVVRATEDLASFLDKCLGGSGAIVTQLATDAVVAYP
jgi:hypothetical protein